MGRGIDNSIADRLLFESRTIQHDTGFMFLKGHNGFRNGKIHTLLGVASGGKSTMLRSMVLDQLEYSGDFETIGVWLSEESVDEFVTEFRKIGYEKPTDKLYITSELSKDLNPEQMLSNLETTIVEEDISVLFIDNITTSKMYMDLPANVQSDFIVSLKKIIKKYDVATILVAHTGAQITNNINRLIDQNDVRGGKGVVNLSEFFYILQSFHINNTIYPTLRLTKHRGQDIDHKLYRLRYHKQSSLYVQDLEIEFKELREAWKMRNHL